MAAIASIVAIMLVAAGCDDGDGPSTDLPTDVVTAVSGSSSPTGVPAETSNAPNLVGTPSATAQASPSLTASSSRSPAASSPSRTGPVTPTAAPTEHSEAGAVAAANAYIRAVDHAYASGDVTQMKEDSAPKCRCADIAREIAQGKHDGYRWKGDRFTILNPNVGTFTDDDGRTYTVAVLASVSELKTVGPDGEPFNDPDHALGSERAHPRLVNMITVRWTSGKWTVIRVTGEDR